MTPEEVATAFALPVQAVLEAIAYCQSDPPEIKQDWEREEAIIKKRGTETDISVNAARPLEHETIP